MCPSPWTWTSWWSWCRKWPRTTAGLGGADIRLRISGLKHSGELSCLRLCGALGPPLLFLLQALAGRQINLALTVCHAGPDATQCLCLAPGDGAAALALARQAAAEHGLAAPELLGDVRLITLYPLANGLALPAQTLACLARAGASPVAMATSLSAVVTVVRGHKLAASLEALRHCFDLPPSASPPDQSVKVVQSPLHRGEG